MAFHRMDSAAINTLLRSPQGGVVRHLAVRASGVQTRARVYVGKETHRLEQSIVKRFASDARGPAVLVGSSEPHALLHHNPTRPHVIRPRNAKVLRFKPKGASVFVFASVVHHPGTKGTFYLTRALRDEFGGGA